MAKQALGTTVTFGTTPGLIAGLKDIAYSGLTRESLDVTTYDSNGYKEYAPSVLKEPGELTLTIIYDTADEDWFDLLDDQADTNQTVTITHKDGTDWVFSGHVNSWVTNMPLEGTDPITAELVIKLSGPMTITPAA